MARATPEMSRSPDRTPPEAAAAALTQTGAPSVAFAQRSKVETAKTTTKRAAFVANTVQKTPTYPIDENHAQSTTMLLMRPSAKRQDDDGDRHANASQGHAPYASRGPGQGLTAAAVWVNDGNWPQREPSSDGSRHLGWHFRGTAEPMTTFACCRFSGKRAQGAGMHPSRV